MSKKQKPAIEQEIIDAAAAVQDGSDPEGHELRKLMAQQIMEPAPEAEQIDIEETIAQWPEDDDASAPYPRSPEIEPDEDVSAQDEQKEIHRADWPDGISDASKRLEVAIFLVLLDNALAIEMPRRADFDRVADCLNSFILANPEAPHAALLMQVKMKLKLVFLPDLDPRKLQLVLKLFREAVLGLDVIRRDDETQRQLAEAAEAAKRPGHVRDDERAVKPSRGPFDLSDFGRAMPKGE